MRAFNKEKETMEKLGEEKNMKGMFTGLSVNEALEWLCLRAGTPAVKDALITFVLKAHDPKRAEVEDTPSVPWLQLTDTDLKDQYVIVGDQQFFNGYAILAGRGKMLHEMTREEEDDFLAREGVGCFLPLINGKIYDIVEGLPLFKKMPVAVFERAPVPYDAVRITIEQDSIGQHWSDCSMASTLVFQAFVQAGYRNVTHRSGAYPSRNYHDCLANPVETIRALENSDRQARETGTPQHALRNRTIIIDQLPNLDEDGVPKTTLTYKNGRPVGYGGGPYWDRQPKEEG
jgi:hypothetical protein